MGHWQVDIKAGTIHRIIIATGCATLK